MTKINFTNFPKKTNDLFILKLVNDWKLSWSKWRTSIKISLLCHQRAMTSSLQETFNYLVIELPKTLWTFGNELLLEFILNSSEYLLSSRKRPLFKISFQINVIEFCKIPLGNTDHIFVQVSNNHILRLLLVWNIIFEQNQRIYFNQNLF